VSRENLVEGIIPFIHPDFEATTPPNLASEPDTYRGHDGLRRWFTLRARGKTSGLDFGQPAVMVWSFRDGKAIGIELFETLDEALAAAGAQ
jgi:ketosteroid isomerase-like protein